MAHAAPAEALGGALLAGAMCAQSGGISINQDSPQPPNGTDTNLAFGFNTDGHDIIVTPAWRSDNLGAAEETLFAVSPCGAGPLGFDCTSNVGVNDPSHVLVHQSNIDRSDSNWAPVAFYITVI